MGDEDTLGLCFNIVRPEEAEKPNVDNLQIPGTGVVVGCQVLRAAYQSCSD